MNEWNKLKTHRVLFALAIASTLVTVLEGLLYYSTYEDFFFRILLTLQNTIKAFTFKSSISLESARSFMLQDPTPYKTVLGYAYMLAVFIAPYCTIATIYKLMERALRFGFLFGKASNKQRIIVFGYNETVKCLLGSADPDKMRIHVVCDSDEAVEERYRLFRKGIKLHAFDPIKAKDDELPGLFGDIELAQASYILLMDDSSIRNFSLLHTLNSRGHLKKKGDRGIPPKVICRCEDDGILRMIENYYDTKSQETSAEDRKVIAHRDFDLEILNIPERQVRKMYETGDGLHSYWCQSDENGSVISREPPQKWRVHLLILGFGKLGQQVLLQAMNLGTAHKDNPIWIDVIDREIDDKRSLFFSRFAPDAFQERKDAEDFCVNPEWADGNLTIRFIRSDVKFGMFRTLLGSLTQGEAGPITYAVAAMDNPDTGVYSAMELRRFLSVTDPLHCGEVPIMLRMDSDRRLEEYLKSPEGKAQLSGVSMIASPEEILTFEDLFSKDIDQWAKQCNAYYAHMFSGTGERVSSDKAWSELTLFRRNANRASAQHNKVLEQVICAEFGQQTTAHLKQTFEKNDAPVRWDLDEKTWCYPLGNNSGKFLKLVHQDRNEFLLRMLQTEHRRWCYYTLSLGWARGSSPEKDDQLRLNPCLVGWNELERVKPDTCQYDLMPLMAEFEKIQGNKNLENQQMLKEAN